MDFKIVNFLFGQERGYTKYPPLSLELESPGLVNQRKSQCRRAKHHQKDFFSPFHIKLALMKRFVKALDKEGSCFQYLRSSFSVLSKETIKAVFLLSSNTKMIDDENFLDSMIGAEKDALFTDLCCTQFLWLSKSR